MWRPCTSIQVATSIRQTTRKIQKKSLAGPTIVSSILFLLRNENKDEDGMKWREKYILYSVSTKCFFSNSTVSVVRFHFPGIIIKNLILCVHIGKWQTSSCLLLASWKTNKIRRLSFLSESVCLSVWNSYYYYSLWKYRTATQIKCSALCSSTGRIIFLL